MRQRRAFTLIELLVVVAIIGLLIAILMPALAVAKRTARTAACLSNTRSMGEAAQMYVADWTVMFPFYIDEIHSWTQLLMNGGKGPTATGYAKTGGYGGTDQMRVCPEAPTAIPNAPTPNFGTAQLQWSNSPETGNGISGSYGINGWLYNINSGDPQLMTMADERGVVSTDPYSTFYRVLSAGGEARTPAFADCNWRHVFAKPADPIPASLQNPGPQDYYDHPIERTVMDRHHKAVNVAFMDGHAETVKLSALWTLKWSVNWVQPSPLPVIK